MTLSNAAPDDLLGEVRALSATIAGLNERLEVAAAETRANTRSRRRHRIAIALSIVGLLIDFALSGLFLYQHSRQNCINDRSANFFQAEEAKVAGQIKGVDLIVPNSRTGATSNPVAGVKQFRAASQHYLTKISELDGC